MVLCHTSGVAWESVYNWNVDEFIDVYHAIQRNHTRDFLQSFGGMQQAFGGDKKSIKAFIKSVSIWLPPEERGDKKGVDDFLNLVRKGLKLKK